MTAGTYQAQPCFGSLDVVNLYGSIPLEGQVNVFDTAADFIEDRKQCTIFRDTDKLDIVTLLRLATCSDTVIINDNCYKQRRGLAMGNNLSPFLAIVFMHHIEGLIQERCVQDGFTIYLWVRYIDDIFLVANAPLERALDIANDLVPEVKFTLENSSDRELPFLDTTVRFNEQAMSFSTSLYVKPSHSGHILPFNSSVPLLRKIGTMKTERLRALRNCSSGEGVAPALQVLAGKFVANGYPRELVHKHIYSNGTKTNRRNRSNIDGKPVVYMRLPFLSAVAEQQFRAAIRRVNLPVHIRPIFISEAPLSVQLSKRQTVNCGPKCVCSNRRLCNRKNVVYKVWCKLCNQFYIGETGRTLRTRVKEHLTQASSNVYRHFSMTHGCAPTLNNIHFISCGGGFFDAAHRKAFEAQLITTDGPQMNVQLA